jgi:hypothetical protein
MSIALRPLSHRIFQDFRDSLSSAGFTIKTNEFSAEDRVAAEDRSIAYLGILDGRFIKYDQK